MGASQSPLPSFISPRVKRHELEPNHSSLSIAEIKNIPSYFGHNNFFFNLHGDKTK